MCVIYFFCHTMCLFLFPSILFLSLTYSFRLFLAFFLSVPFFLTIYQWSVQKKVGCSGRRVLVQICTVFGQDSKVLRYDTLNSIVFNLESILFSAVFH